MKFFRIYVFPALYGLLVYFTIRLLHDTDVGLRFWHRYWLVNVVEICCSVFAGYAGIGLFNRLLRYFDEQLPSQLSYKAVIRELAILVVADLVLMNVILVPMDIGLNGHLPLEDVADINVIPTLYTIMYYGIVRSRKFLKAYVDNKLQLEKVTNDHLVTELKFLKSQYHPHFLFNALNTIYFQMDEDVDGAKKSIEKFSELLRYQLYDQQQQVPVTSEIAYLQSFINLQKLRSSDKLKIDVNFDERLNGQLVYPLLFLPLVENAFKFIGGDYRLTIDTTIADHQIIFTVKNSMPAFERIVKSTGGIGLENLKRRLDLLYPQRHSLLTKTAGNSFFAELKLQYE